MRLEKLRKRRDYLAANGGRRWSTPGFVLLAHPRQAAASGDAPAAAAVASEAVAVAMTVGDASRVGFTVTKRVGNAVIRNRLKRRLRALARESLAPEARPGIDYVFIGRSGGLTRAWDDLVADLKRGLGKLHRT